MSDRNGRRQRVAPAAHQRAGLPKSGVLALGLLSASAALCATAYGAGSITVHIGSAVTNVGDAVEIPVSLDAGAESPTALALFIAYDSAKLAPIEDFYVVGQTDPAGGTGAVSSAVRPAQAVLDAGLSVDSEIHPEGVIVIVLFGMSHSAIPGGDILTIAFRVLPAAGEGDVLALSGVGEDDPVVLGGTQAWSTAADASLEDIPVLLSDGAIDLGCDPAGTPTNVAASQDRADGVLVTWSAVPDAGAEYRVFRHTDVDSTGAMPLGSQWQSGTSFLDVTAEAAVATDSGGCFGAVTYDVTEYYYWVKARTAGGREGDLSAPPAMGFRDVAKLNRAMTLAPILPATPEGSRGHATLLRPGAGPQRASRIAGLSLPPSALTPGRAGNVLLFALVSLVLIATGRCRWRGGARPGAGRPQPVRSRRRT